VRCLRCLSRRTLPAIRAAPTAMGYTGQWADTTTGLDYYHARYYDPVTGQFTGADSVTDGLNRYGYVGGNPTPRPSRQGIWCALRIALVAAAAMSR
jgi:RHS repeat-associated protein